MFQVYKLLEDKTITKVATFETYEIAYEFIVDNNFIISPEHFVINIFLNNLTKYEIQNPKYISYNKYFM